VVSGLSCTCARFAEDIRNVVNDLQPDGIRVLPVLGVGGLQNLNDVLFLKGIDMGVVDEDNLRLLKRRDPQLYANIEQRVQYITKLKFFESKGVQRSQTLEEIILFLFILYFMLVPFRSSAGPETGNMGATFRTISGNPLVPFPTSCLDGLPKRDISPSENTEQKRPAEKRAQRNIAIINKRTSST